MVKEYDNELQQLLEIITRNTNWNNMRHDGGQAKSVFTTLCIVEKIEERENAEKILKDVYEGLIEGVYNISYARYASYMLGIIKEAFCEEV